MASTIRCVCGYRGPSVPEGDAEVCPLCRGRVQQFGPSGGGLLDAADDAVDAVAPAEPTIYRIPCPRGHVLRVTDEMLGEQACCPKCNEWFVLRASDSVEFRREQARRQAEAEERAARAWLMRAIVAAVLVGLFFVALLVITLNPSIVRR